MSGVACIDWFRKSRVTLGLFGCMLLSVAGTVHAEVSEDEFQHLHQLLAPSADTVWRSIPWKIELLAAQEIAARRQLPIFIWAMDGHPLGCT
ncbi:MAG TPA: hypothetical protein DCY79_18055 [Planctomycetaceae bacterium]|nr:hypothetical protein [Blastopirellula sp.]HAY81711.1 hypothetical protein [Planctomycetaceae bacterium]|tara:strand:- start:1198 stop:1473 length:276 start_codon:yes stop_codon:yes gene_type:complete